MIINGTFYSEPELQAKFKALEEENAELKKAVRAERHGEWKLFAVDDIGKVFTCSLCGRVATTENFETSPIDNEEYYCARCGAKMDGETS